MTSLNQGIIGRILLRLPPLSIQKKIVAILTAYDDLIENNTQRIKILEEMAQALYRDWFIKFRFPGSRKVRMVDSPFGKIPDGWKVGSLGDIASLHKDKFIEKKHSPLPLLDLARIPRKSLAISGFGQWNEITTSRIIFEEGDILFGSIRPYFHKVVIAPCKGVTNVSVFVIRSKSAISNLFLFNVLFSDDAIAWANQYSGGTKMPVIRWDVFSKMEIPIPPENILDKFNCILSPFLNAIPVIIHKNLNLRRTRDLLLPKLISGEVDVEKLDINIPTEAA